MGREEGRKYKRMTSWCCTQDFPNRSIKPFVWFPLLHCPLVVESHWCFDRKMKERLVSTETGGNHTAKKEGQGPQEELPASMQLVGSLALHELPVHALWLCERRLSLPHTDPGHHF